MVDKTSVLGFMSSEETRGMNRVARQSENCLACTWFRPNDPLNADLFERGMCVEPKLKAYELVVSGRDLCNLYKAVRQKQIELLQEGEMKD